MTQLKSPLVYRPELEIQGSDEPEATEGLKRALRGILRTTARDYGHAVRSVHAKGHAIVRGRLRIHAGLPEAYAQGLFAQPGEHEAILRFSTNPGDLLDDAISVPRGLGLKILGVRGQRLPHAPERFSQDFLFASGPAFGAANPGGFLRLLRLLALTTDRGEGLKKRLSRVLGTVRRGLEAVHVNIRTLSRLGGAPNLHPLGQTYFSQTPFLYGRNIAKFQLAPLSPGLAAVTGRIVDTRDRPDALREEIARVLKEEGGVWALRVQLCVDAEAMPIEDATAVWSTDLAPFVTVATLTVWPQVSWVPDISDEADRRLAFSVWNGLAAHRPLGGINRARRAAYAYSAAWRGEFNGCPVHRTAEVRKLLGRVKRLEQSDENMEHA